MILCNKDNCIYCLQKKEIIYEELNIVQYIKICKRCNYDPQLIIKSQYLLTTNSANKKHIYGNNNNLKIIDIIKTLLLIANTKHQCINKYCMLYIIIPNIIMNYIETTKCHCDYCISVSPHKCIRRYTKCENCLKHCKDFVIGCDYCKMRVCAECQQNVTKYCIFCINKYCPGHGNTNGLIECNYHIIQY